jgi:hypothetical protein
MHLSTLSLNKKYNQNIDYYHDERTQMRTRLLLPIDYAYLCA